MGDIIVDNKIKFILGLHSHQPVGNFDYVFEHGYQVSYLPFLQTLARFPQVQAVLHYSGPLLEWLSDNQPDFFNLIRELIRRGQVEIMGGGHYEPILPVISYDDRVGQLSFMSRYLKKKLGVTIRGAWLTERIWEPHLPVALAETGLEYVTVDDSHFLAAGFDLESLHDYYLSEDENSLLAIFPISERLRYMIPFHEVEEVLEFFRAKASSLPSGSTLVLADDGEKFGMWPGTHDWVYKQGWLEKFFTSLTENKDWLETTTFSKVLDKTPAAGRVYLPAASYLEMGGWTLPAEACERFHALHDRLEAEGSLGDFTPFLRGSFWRNFLIKYPESNWMHKRVNALSQKIHRSLDGKKSNYSQPPEYLRRLWMAQCNCAYWHGIFGGLYLPHLRHAVFKCLLESERLFQKLQKKATRSPVVAEQADIDLDGEPEIKLANHLVSLFIKPNSGGAITELDDLRTGFNLNDTLARRREAYHVQMAAGPETGVETSGHATIHNRRFAEKIEPEAFTYDPYPRYSLREHFFISPPASPEAAACFNPPDIGNFADSRFSHRLSRGPQKASLKLSRCGCLRMPEQPYFTLQLDKTIELAANSNEVLITYRLKNADQQILEAFFAVSFNITVLGPDDPQVGWLTPEAGPGSLKDGFALAGSTGITVYNHRDGVNFSLDFFKPAETLIQYPVSTVSQSESGIDRTYQASCLLPIWPLKLKPGSTGNWKIKMSLTPAKS
jgi:4-alpha-glucanotransferase